MAKKTPDDATPGIQVTPVHIGGESILDRLVPHIKKIAVAVGVVIAILMVVFTVRWWQERGRTKKTRGLVASIELGRRNVVEPPDPAAGPIDPASTPGADEPTYPSHQERAVATVEDLARRGVGDLAGPAYRGTQLLTAGRLDDAERVFSAGARGTGLEAALAREGLGLVAEARAQAATDAAEKEKQLTAALASFAAGKAEGQPRRAYALYHEARVLQRLGRAAEAITSFEQALEALGDRPADLKEAIEARLAQLEASR
ncbi:MAG: hypothetical protein KBG28_17875 [Kofleriaceae bacterium]|nr:hypothetical protein [Kofleriaceae bacterium]MBP9205848.1 hypothetical protein [Kofleriaceae bacterium]